MRGTVGDQLVVRSRHLRSYERRGEIVEVRGADGGPPFVVRWEPDGSLGLFFPGPDVVVRGLAAPPVAPGR
jgi:Domain of unknown function (DUF1918)